MGNCCLRICGESIRVPDHPHKLHLQTSEGTYSCDGCKELGYGKHYVCPKCPSYQLHKECGQPENNHAMHSSFFKEIRFTFHVESPKHVNSCVACGEKVKGYRYQSSREKGFLNRFFPRKAIVLHPCCFKLPTNRDNQGLDASGGTVNLELKERASFNCLMCERKKISQKIEGWAYVSVCHKYCYHVACVKEFFVKKHEQLSDGTNVPLEVCHSALEIGGVIMVMVLRLVISAISGDIISLIPAPVQ